MNYTTPNIDPIDQACLDYEIRTGIKAQTLLKGVTLFISRHDGKSAFCEHNPYQTCTYKINDSAYVIEYRNDQTQGQYLWHEILHVLLDQEGFRGEKSHHAIMKMRGWL